MKIAALLAPFAVVALVGCAAGILPPRDSGFQSNGADANISRATAKAVEELVGTLRAPLDTNKPVLVATAANLDDLNASSTLGRLISEQVVATLSRDGYDVSEIRLRNTMLVDREGEFMLSRDARKLVRSHDAQAVITAGYAVGALRVDVILKAVRLSDGKVIGAASYALPNGPNTQSLVSDGPDAPGVAIVGM